MRAREIFQLFWTLGQKRVIFTFQIFFLSWKLHVGLWKKRAFSNSHFLGGSSEGLKTHLAHQDDDHAHVWAQADINKVLNKCWQKWARWKTAVPKNILGMAEKTTTLNEIESLN